LVFNRHMFLNIWHEAVLLALQNMRQRKIQTKQEKMKLWLSSGKKGIDQE